MFTFEIPGRPAPKGSRVSGISKSGVRFNREANPRVYEWMKLAVEHLEREAVLQSWHTAPKDTPLVLEVVFTLEQPKRSRYVYPPSGDLDKYVRCLADSLTKAELITDDSQLVEIRAQKRYGAVSSTRGTVSPA